MAAFIHAITQLTMDQLLFFTNLWKQLLECFLVLYETLKNRRPSKHQDACRQELGFGEKAKLQ